MIKAEEYAKDDQELKDKIEAKNQLEGLVYQTRQPWMKIKNINYYR